MATITDSIGRVLAGRYRIESALGSGASAHVFGAWDVTLRRRVAIKVLHPALVGDAAFLRRFRAEAQAAASLAHPHVLAVHDWGEDESGPFLVLELCAGGSLRDVLDDGRRLTVTQALVVGAEAAEGLAFAHGRGFVHRDIKPANLLFGEDGRLRVADFGLARALAEAAWTEPVGTTVGTARYAAPEQAQGRPVDGRADVYSLALVLYEAVTGLVPFTSDTTLATLMARVGAPLPGHDSLGVLSAVLQAAAAPEPDQRIDAASLAERLRALSADMPPAEPLTLPGPGGHRLSSSSPPPAIGGGSDDVTELGVVAGRPGTGASPARSGPPADTGRSAGPEGARRGGRDRARRFPGGGLLRVVRRAPRATAAVLVCLLVLAGAGYAVDASQILVASRRLPSVTGDTQAAAAASLHRDHLVLRVTGRQWSLTVASGDVIRQSPAAGKSVKVGSTVGVSLSSGPPPVAVPSLASVTGGCAQVTAMLTAAKLRTQCVPQSSTTVASGKVLGWSPQGHGPEGSSVRVVISSGPPLETIPNLSGSTCQGVTTALQAVGLVPQCQQVYSTTVADGQVVSWSPQGQAPEGSTVTVQVSQGPPLVTVPSIYGRTVSQAVAMLQSAGLVAGSDYGPVGGTVFDSNPAEGASVPEGSTVTLYSQ